MLRKVILCKQKKPEGTQPMPIQQGNWQVFINIKKYKIVFRIRKNHLRIIVCLMAIYDFCFKQFTRMQRRLRKQ